MPKEKSRNNAVAGVDTYQQIIQMLQMIDKMKPK